MTERQKRMKFNLYVKIDREKEVLRDMKDDYRTSENELNEQKEYIRFLENSETMLYNFS